MVGPGVYRKSHSLRKETLEREEKCSGKAGES